nr:MAG TPA: Transcriptional regulator turn helix, DNA-binding, Transcription [Caudoviricetes sp.]
MAAAAGITSNPYCRHWQNGNALLGEVIGAAIAAPFFIL